jgi:tRNA (guanosine-2'-O-)-methyltransferase
VPSPRRIERIRQVARARQQGALVLEDVRDVFNARAACRSAEAFGFQRVCQVFGHCKPYDLRANPKSVARGTTKWLDIVRHESIEQCCAQLKAEGYTLYAAALADNALKLNEARFAEEKIALLIGNERFGLTRKALELSDHKLLIPMRGMVQSLNLSVTAGICFYEITRQRLAAGMDGYLYPEDEQRAREEDFLGR